MFQPPFKVPIKLEHVIHETQTHAHNSNYVTSVLTYSDLETRLVTPDSESSNRRSSQTSRQSRGGWSRIFRLGLSRRVLPSSSSAPGSPRSSPSTTVPSSPRPSWRSRLRVKVSTLGVIIGLAVGVTQTVSSIFYSGPEALTDIAKCVLVGVFFIVSGGLYWLIKSMECEE